VKSQPRIGLGSPALTYALHYRYPRCRECRSGRPGSPDLSIVELAPSPVQRSLRNMASTPPQTTDPPRITRRCRTIPPMSFTHTVCRHRRSNVCAQRSTPQNHLTHQMPRGRRRFCRYLSRLYDNVTPLVKHELAVRDRVGGDSESATTDGNASFNRERIPGPDASSEAMACL
jgi:hypothetical protein